MRLSGVSVKMGLKCFGQPDEKAPEMQRHEKMIQGYEKKQVKLRQKIRLLQAVNLKSGGGKTDTMAIIQRTERQIADLEKAIVRCREKG